MKILKHGDLQPRKFTCTKCGCEFVADMAEYGKATYDHPIRGPYINYYITCPECRNDITVNNAPLYEDEEIDEHIAKGCGSLIDFHKKKLEWYKIMHDILDAMEELENESKTNS